jgi:hypothetical protein
MSLDYLRFTPRGPRFTPASNADVEVEQIVGGQPCLIQAELRNLSRNGYQLKSNSPVNSQEPLTLKLRIEGSEIEVRLPGSVRWQRATPDGTWLVGCQTNCAMELETLGELFLSGALSPNNS